MSIEVTYIYLGGDGYEVTIIWFSSSKISRYVLQFLGTRRFGTEVGMGYLLTNRDGSRYGLSAYKPGRNSVSPRPTHPRDFIVPFISFCWPHHKVCSSSNIQIFFILHHFVLRHSQLLSHLGRSEIWAPRQKMGEVSFYVWGGILGSMRPMVLSE
jgi:hypothetical protein